MRAIWIVILGCGASAPKPGIEHVGELTPPVKSNYCPSRLLGAWVGELFPACTPPQYMIAAPLCMGSVCGQPCQVTSSGYGGAMGRDRYDHVLAIGYDQQGRYVSTTGGGLPPTTCSYEGDRLSSCKSDDHVASVERDARGRITAYRHGGESEAVRYDEQGRVVAVGDHELKYDERGWVSHDADEEIAHDETGHVLRIGRGEDATVFEYDRERLIRSKGPRSFNASFAYDARGRVTRIRTGGFEAAGSTQFVYECGP